MEHRCCGPYLARTRDAPTPEALMRSRYAAYAKGDFDYIRDTTDPTGPRWEADEARWRASVAAFSKGARFLGVVIVAAEPPEGDEGFVSFHARLEAHGRDVGFGERSRFLRREGRWRYVDGVAEG